MCTLSTGKGKTQKLCNIQASIDTIFKACSQETLCLLATTPTYKLSKNKRQQIQKRLFLDFCTEEVYNHFGGQTKHKLSLTVIC